MRNTLIKVAKGRSVSVDVIAEATWQDMDGWFSFTIRFKDGSELAGVHSRDLPGRTQQILMGMEAEE